MKSESSWKKVWLLTVSVKPEASRRGGATGCSAYQMTPAVHERSAMLRMKAYDPRA